MKADLVRQGYDLDILCCENVLDIPLLSYKAYLASVKKKFAFLNVTQQWNIQYKFATWKSLSARLSIDLYPLVAIQTLH